MNNNFKQTHNLFCNYEIRKAKGNSRFYSVKTKAEENNKVHGIKTADISKAMLVRELASIF